MIISYKLQSVSFNNIDFKKKGGRRRGGEEGEEEEEEDYNDYDYLV